MEFAIKIKDVQFSYGNKVILDSVNINVPQSSIFGFLGLNGAGKSTLIKVLLGLLSPQKGTIEVLGVDVNKNRLKALSKIGAFVEAPALYPNLSVYDYLRVKQTLLSLKRTEIDKVIDILDLRTYRNIKSKNLSLGLKQRLSIAFALLGDPDLLILDEPANGLDPDGIKDMRELILTLNRDLQKTIFMSTHILDEVERVCTDVAIIDKGKILICDKLERVVSGSKNILQVKVDDPLKANNMLCSRGFNCENVGDILKIKVEGDDEISLINQLLVNSNVKVFMLSPLNKLEDTFFKLTSYEHKIN